MNIHLVITDTEDGHEVIGVYGSRKRAELELVGYALRERLLINPEIQAFNCHDELMDVNGAGTGLYLRTMPVLRG